LGYLQTMSQTIDKELLRRERILQAAKRAFEKDGLSKASMRSIAREAGSTTGAIYPLFEGKEDIYANLLKDSLVELYGHVAKACAGESDACKALLASATAWFKYYESRPFESDLGLYLHGGDQARGLGRERDRQLNAKLMKSLDVFKNCFIRLAPADLKKKEIQTWAEQERNSLFASLIGILMLYRTGRTRSIGTDSQVLLQSLLKALEKRICA